MIIRNFISDILNINFFLENNDLMNLCVENSELLISISKTKNKCVYL